MHVFSIALAALILGLILGAIFGSVLTRRAIVLNIRRLAAAPSLTIYNTKRHLRQSQIARMALRDAAIIVAGAEPEDEDCEP